MFILFHGLYFQKMSSIFIAFSLIFRMLLGFESSLSLFHEFAFCLVSGENMNLHHA